MSKEKSAVYNILAFNFDGEKTVKETVKEIKKSGALDGQAIVAESIVSVNEKGRFTFTSRGMASWVAPLVLLTAACWVSLVVIPDFWLKKLGC